MSCTRYCGDWRRARMIEWIVSSCFLIAVIIALRYILKGKISLRLQYSLWALVLLRLLVPVSFGSTGFSVMNMLPENPAEAVLSAALSVGVPHDAYTLTEGTIATPEENTAAGVQNETPRCNEGAVTDVEAHVMDWGTIALAVWFTGIAVVGLFLLIFNLRFAARIKKTRRVMNAGEYKLPVYVTNAVDTPCLFGLFHPAIYVTDEAAENEVKLHHALEHEATHFRHGDHIWSILRGVCLALHWYNPLVWWAAVISRRDAELACDEDTIRRIGEGERAEYGRTLIGMTCQKRTALLLAATTMTGSRSSIKERIMLIAKKPKTAFYTLASVVLIAVVAVGCTFTRAENNNGPWSWARDLSQESVTSVELWEANDLRPLSADEITTLVSILNSLKQENFTENKDLVGGTPGYGLRIITSSGEYDLNESIAPAGAFEMSYGDKQWWIDSAALYELWDSAGHASAPAEYGAADIDSIIIDCLNSDGAYAEAAQYNLIECLIKFPAHTLEAVGARDEGIQNWLCWTIAENIKGMALDAGDALTADGLSENGRHACALIIEYLSEDKEAPESWRQIYLDFWKETLSVRANDGEILGIGLMDFNFDGVPELAVWQPSASASEFAVLYYTDGTQTYHNIGSGYNAVLCSGHLSDYTLTETPPPTFWLVRSRETDAHFWCVHSQNGQDDKIWGGYQLLYADDERLVGSYESDAGAQEAWEAFDSRYEIVDLDYSAFVLSVLAGDSLDTASVNALLNSWRPFN